MEGAFEEMLHFPKRMVPWDPHILVRFKAQIERAMARTLVTFKQADLVRAVKAVRSAGLDVARTEIMPDGTIRLIHSDGSSPPKSDYDRLEAEL